jgi:hypothetical protein
MSPIGEAPPPQRAARRPRSGWVTAFMVLVGIILLLPGLCAIIFGIAQLTWADTDSTVTSLVILGLMVGFGGVMLIRAAFRGRAP